MPPLLRSPIRYPGRFSYAEGILISTFAKNPDLRARYETVMCRVRESLPEADREAFERFCRESGYTLDP